MYRVLGRAWWLPWIRSSGFAARLGLLVASEAASQVVRPGDERPEFPPLEELERPSFEEPELPSFEPPEREPGLPPLELPAAPSIGGYIIRRMRQLRF